MIAFVHNAEQAEDLTQDAFCRAFQHVDGYDPQGHFTAWLKRIAINLAKDCLRRQKQATFVPLHEWEEAPATDRRGDPLAALATGALRDDLRERRDRDSAFHRFGRCRSLVVSQTAEQTVSDVTGPLDLGREFFLERFQDYLALEQGEEEQRQRWERVGKLAPGLMAAGERIIETVVSAAIKAQLGL